MSGESNLVDVNFVYLPVINFSMQQNRVPVIRQFTLENKTDSPLEQVKIKLTAEPAFLSISPYYVELIQAGETVRLDNLQLELSTSFFAQLTERLAGYLSLEIRTNGALVFKSTYPIDILAFDQWGGLSVLPEMLSSFITPNHPALVPITQRAAVILGQWTGNPSLNEYQSSNIDRVWKQMAAVYAAITELDITYSTVPASFEQHGQRVRLADSLTTDKLGNCLDMALLYAACLEAIGLYPLLVFTQGHAFAGAWLIPETFPDSITDDESFLTKRTAIGINEIALVEATGMNQGSSLDFSGAVKVANAKLVDPADFVMALDVKRTRFAGIRPLPLRIWREQQWELVVPEETTDKEQTTPETINRYDLSSISSQVVVTKLLLWERKLLDLSLRNNLLNLRVTKNTLQLISADLDKFEDALANGEEFRLMPKPTDWDNPLFNFGIYQPVDSSNPIMEFVKAELSQKRLHAYLNELELSRNLLHIYRSARLSLEENGANTLYLALGMLKWHETPDSERPRYAPILLIPLEIIRKSAAKGYIIRSREEDTMINITLLEMLRLNFGITVPGLDPLPTDESGVNVQLIYAIVRQAIMEQKKWDVLEQAILGIFSFSKFIMWNDIHNNSHQLAKNKIVSSLMNGRIEWDVQGEMVDAATLDQTVSPAEIVLPVSADSSQLEAIYEAMNGKNFILHGPPGTGKSQTITNIIANALYKGKRVLFVAEKMAALSVVQSRLAALGLAPFCLEIHSNKTKKSAILSQLKTTLEVVKQQSPEDFEQEAARLFQLRIQLNTYIEALHQKYPFGLSLYDAINQYLRIECRQELDVPPNLIDELTKSKLQDWQEAVQALVGVGNACGHPYQHPLTGIKIKDYSVQLKDTATTCMRGIIELLQTIKQQLGSLAHLLKNNSQSYDMKQIRQLHGIVNTLLDLPELTPSLITLPLMAEVLDEYREVVSRGKIREVSKTTLALRFTEDVLAIDAQQLLLDWDQYGKQWFVAKHFGQKKIVKRLNSYAVGVAVTDSEVRELLFQILHFKGHSSYIQGYEDQLPLLFGKFGKKGMESWSTIEQIIDGTLTLNKLLLGFSANLSDCTMTKKALAAQLTEGMQTFKEIHGAALSQLQASLSSFQSLERTLTEQLGLGKEALYKDGSPEWITQATTQLQAWLSNIHLLKDWCQWLMVRDRLDLHGIAFVADAYKEQNIPTDQLETVFTKSYLHGCIRHILSQQTGLEMFKGKLFDDVIQRYKEINARFEEQTKHELYAKLASTIPVFTKEAAHNSEVGILQKNIRNNGRGLSIRKLFDQIPTLLSRMSPCMLMSPISVAQYIDPEADQFDLIIFDEASQMPTYEAIGAIARGKQVVIVGDPKQMPPTSFFTNNSVDEDNMEMEDLESILDDCLALSIPSKYLLWHYRSKHESLIAFSNSEYYDNKLLTFPSPDNIESKVSFVPIAGFYDKGKSRHNKAEAQAVVNEIARRLRDPELRKKSIGVVTFSSVQQTLVEDLLSDLFISHPSLESQSLESEEPLFIKNLENVQGDERDVILFSVGYGPDADGKVSMNFGPLNRTGGERRLNVAVSRARYQMIVFSTLTAKDIDLNRTSAIGVAGLKRFLEYAEKGNRIVSDRQTNASLSVALEQLIAKEIRKHGYTVHTNIGCSGYKIDLGVVDPNKEWNYLLGVLCDGENYRQTKTTRDREIVQHNVLRLLGWNICRVWTMDWWEHPEKVTQSILSAIKKAEMHKNDEPLVPNEQVKAGGVDIVCADPRENAKPACTSPKTNNNKAIPYQFATLTPSDQQSVDSFLSAEHRVMVLSQIEQVVEQEAPISKALLCKKILTAWGISRTGQRIDAYFEQLLGTFPCYKIQHHDIVFLWKNKEQHNTFTHYRLNSNRDAVDLPPEEIANSIKQLLQEQISLPCKDLMRLTAQQFGFARSGTNVEAAIARGMEEAEKRKYVKVENERAIVL